MIFSMIKEKLISTQTMKEHVSERNASSLLLPPENGTHMAGKHPACPVGWEVHDSVPSFPQDGTSFSAGEDALQKEQQGRGRLTSEKTIKKRR